MSSVRRLLFLALFFVSAGVPLWVAWSRIGTWMAKPLPVLATLPEEFRVTDHTGSAVRGSELRGKVWVANFIFTRCRGICPALTAQMRQLVNRCGADPDVLFVSVSVDPGHDTPAVLREYREKQSAQFDRWRFWTGEREALVALVRKGFLLGVEEGPDADEPIVHSNRFAVVDRQLRIRAYHSMTEEKFLDAVCSDIEALLRESHEKPGEGRASS